MIRRSSTTFLLLVPLVTVGPAGTSELTCFTPEALTQTILAGEVETLRLSTGSGRLRVEGQPATDTVLIRGEACALDPAILSDFSLELKAEGKTLVLTDQMPEGANHPEAQFAKLHLHVAVPQSLRVEIDAKREPTEISGIAGLKLRSRHGDIRIDGVHGDVEVHVDRGDLEIGNVAGDLALSRNRGEAIIRSVGGNVTVTDSQRGNVLVTDVTGNVRFHRHGRGNLAVQRIGGDFIVDSIQEGRIHHEGVRGQISLATPSGLPENDGADEDHDGGLGPPHLR